MGMARSLLAIVVPGRPTSLLASSGVRGRMSRSRCSRPICTPCASPGHLMPVDSNLERQTLALLLSLQDWLSKRRNVRVTIDKPVFDLGWSSAPAPAQAVGGVPVEAEALLIRIGDGHRASLTTLRELGIKHRPVGDEEARDPCVPDFILWAEADHAIQHGVVIVETMGFADDTYRERKHYTHGLMSRILGMAPVVEHDFHLPEGMLQKQRDRDFWLRTRWVLTGPESNGSLTL